jgi:hypothetical protein
MAFRPFSCIRVPKDVESTADLSVPPGALPGKYLRPERETVSQELCNSVVGPLLGGVSALADLVIPLN